jgi:Niemann-Pick C1 protein
MTCSPNQSQFTNAAKIGTDGSKSYVKELDYAVNMDYADGMFNSCKNVSNPTTGSKALDIICGNWEGEDFNNYLRS